MDDRWVPLVRRVTEPVGAWRAALADPERRLVRIPLLPLLDVLLAADHPDRRVLLTHRHLDRAGATVAQAHRRALAALDEELPEVPREVDEPFVLEGELASSLVLHEGLMARLRGALVAIPTSRSLCVAPPGAWRWLWSEAWRTFQTEGRPLSPVLLEVSDRGVRPWRPASGEAAARAASSQALLRCHAYGEQREDLVDDPDVGLPVVAAQLVMNHRTGAATTRCTWSGEPALLPEVDRVVVGDREVAWEEVVAHMGLVATAHVPPLYRRV